MTYRRVGHVTMRVKKKCFSYPILSIVLSFSSHSDEDIFDAVLLTVKSFRYLESGGEMVFLLFVNDVFFVILVNVAVSSGFVLELVFVRV